MNAILLLITVPKPLNVKTVLALILICLPQVSLMSADVPLVSLKHCMLILKVPLQVISHTTAKMTTNVSLLAPITVISTMESVPTLMVDTNAHVLLDTKLWMVPMKELNAKMLTNVQLMSLNFNIIAMNRPPVLTMTVDSLVLVTKAGLELVSTVLISWNVKIKELLVTLSTHKETAGSVTSLVE